MKFEIGKTYICTTKCLELDLKDEKHCKLKIKSSNDIELAHMHECPCGNNEKWEELKENYAILFLQKELNRLQGQRANDGLTKIEKELNEREYCILKAINSIESENKYRLALELMAEDKIYSSDIPCQYCKYEASDSSDDCQFYGSDKCVKHVVWLFKMQAGINY